jgi:SAM-dependent methyltransferase
MSEVTTGIRAILSRPGVYEIWSRAVGGVHGRSTLVREHVRPQEDDRILDLGCGPGDLVRYLPTNVEYVGVDLQPDYIDGAREHFGTDRRTFRVGDVTALDDGLRDFDIVTVFGMIHHLDDAGARAAFRQAARALRPGGRIITVDPAFTSPQNPWARAVIARDRGQNVRHPEQYEALASDSFADVHATTRSDLLRIPYTHCIVEAWAPL